MEGAIGTVCETQPHCACLAPAGDGLEEYQCECHDDGTGRCAGCDAQLVSVARYERNRAAEIAGAS